MSSASAAARSASPQSAGGRANWRLRFAAVSSFGLPVSFQRVAGCWSPLSVIDANPESPRMPIARNPYG
jgi:hypothetical protein